MNVAAKRGVHGFLPQRSRRLSASGIRALALAVHPRAGASKKQTPFSVWYARRRGRVVGCRQASKKQTPFSVWYAARERARARESNRTPQRSRRLSASGMPPSADHPRLVAVRLKEADAFQRLVCRHQLTIRGLSPSASKKQTPFSVWYAAR